MGSGPPKAAVPLSLLHHLLIYEAAAALDQGLPKEIEINPHLLRNLYHALCS
jgi:hypothetical protein